MKNYNEYKFIPIALFMLAGLSPGLAAAASSESSLQVIFQQAFEKFDFKSMEMIEQYYTAEYRVDNTSHAYVPEDESIEFQKIAPEAKLFKKNVDVQVRSMSSQDQARYLNYTEIQELFKQFQSDHPDFVENVELPWLKSQDGLPIAVLKIAGDVQEENEKEPAIVITGATHGDEWISTAVVLGLADRLIQKYQSDSRFTKMIDWSEIYIIPSASPDSFQKTRQVHGVDPNLIYPYPGNDIEPSIESAKNMVKFRDMIRPVGTLDYHGAPQNGMVFYPWGYASGIPLGDDEDLTRYQEITKAMAETNGYLHGNIADTIFVTPGNTVDAWYYLHKTMALGIEIGSGNKKPPENQIEKYIDECAEMTWLYIEFLLPEDDPNDDDTTTGDDDDTTTGEDDESSTTDDDDDESTSTGDDDDDDDDDDTTTTGDDDDDGNSDGDDESTSTGDDDDDDDDDEDDDAKNNAGSKSPEEPSSSSSSGGGCRVIDQVQHGRRLSAGMYLFVLGQLMRRRRG